MLHHEKVPPKADIGYLLVILRCIPKLVTIHFSRFSILPFLTFGLRLSTFDRVIFDFRY